LECAEGWVYANVYQTDFIVRIDPHSGEVRALIDASDLLSAEERQGTDVLNGIAYRSDNSSFLLTGKNWPKLFEVDFTPPASRP
jgi:glutaminyl-peptide cyclotransferase